jgi:hypothetical protein
MSAGSVPRRARRRIGGIVRRELTYPGLQAGAVRQLASKVLSQLGDEAHEVRFATGANCALAIGGDLVFRVANAWPFAPDCERRAWCAARAERCPAPEYVSGGSIDGRPYVVYRRMPGQHVSTDAGIAAAGPVLAAIHRSDPSHFPSELLSRPRRRARFLLALDAISLLPRSLHRRGRKLVDDAHQDWTYTRSFAVHGDFRRANILQADAAISGVLDWSDCRVGSRESDLGTANAADVSTLVRAYQQAASVSVDLDLVAGHVFARCLALTACGVPGSSLELHRATALAHQGWETNDRI